MKYFYFMYFSRLSGGIPWVFPHLTRGGVDLYPRHLPCTPELAGELLGLKASDLAQIDAG